MEECSSNPIHKKHERKLNQMLVQHSFIFSLSALCIWQFLLSNDTRNYEALSFKVTKTHISVIN